MMRQHVDDVDEPADLLPRLLEYLLIRYDYDADTSTFVMVCEHWDKAPGGDRAFLRLSFSDVEELARERGTLLDLQPFADHYALERDRRPQVFQAIKVFTRGDLRGVDLWFGPAFGGISFAYRFLTQQVRNARVLRRGGEYEEYDYFNLEGGEPMDFYDPFK